MQVFTGLSRYGDDETSILFHIAIIKQALDVYFAGRGIDIKYKSTQTIDMAGMRYNYYVFGTIENELYQFTPTEQNEVHNIIVLCNKSDLLPVCALPVIDDDVLLNFIMSFPVEFGVVLSADKRLLQITEVPCLNDVCACIRDAVTRLLEIQ